MILDVREWEGLPLEQLMPLRRRVFLDGVEIHHVWYVDTDQKYLRTNDVFGDGRQHKAADLRARGEMQDDWDDVDGFACKTMMGKEISLRKVE